MMGMLDQSEDICSLSPSTEEMELQKFTTLVERAKEKIRQQRKLISSYKTKFQKAEQRMKEMEKDSQQLDKQSKKSEALVEEALTRVKKAEKVAWAANKQVATLENQLDVMKQKNEHLEGRCKELQGGNDKIFESVKDLLADCFQSKRGITLAKKKRPPPPAPLLLKRIANASKSQKKVERSTKPLVAGALSEKIHDRMFVNSLEESDSVSSIQPAQKITPALAETWSRSADTNKPEALIIAANSASRIVKPTSALSKRSIERTSKPAKRRKLRSSKPYSNGSREPRTNFAVRSDVIAKINQPGDDDDLAVSNSLSEDEVAKVKIATQDPTPIYLMSSDSEHLVFPQLGEADIREGTQNENKSLQSSSIKKKKDDVPELKSTDIKPQSIVKAEKIPKDDLLPVPVSVSVTPKSTTVETSTFSHLMIPTNPTCKYFVSGSCGHGNKCKFAHDVCPAFQLGKCAKGTNCKFIHRKTSSLYKTRPCKFYMSQGACPHGNDCTFIHGHGDFKRKPFPVSQFLNPEKVANPKALGLYQVNGLALTTQRQVCKFFISGNCSNGHQCPYAHPIPTLDRPTNLTQAGTQFPVNYIAKPAQLNKGDKTIPRTEYLARIQRIKQVFPNKFVCYNFAMFGKCSMEFCKVKGKAHPAEIAGRFGGKDLPPQELIAKIWSKLDDSAPQAQQHPMAQPRGPFAVLPGGPLRNMKKSFRCSVCTLSFLGHFAFNKHLTDSGHRNLSNNSS